MLMIGWMLRKARSAATAQTVRSIGRETTAAARGSFRAFR